MTDGPDPTELVVERVPVAGGRPLMSAALAGSALVLFIGLAVLKPWVPQRVSSAAGPAASGSSTAVLPAPAIEAPSHRPTSSPPLPGADATALPFVPHAAELLATAVRHDNWGIRAVVVPSVTKRFDVDFPSPAERWMAIDVAHGAAWNLTNEGAVENSGDTVLAIGATMPADVKPLGIRFWRLDEAVGPREIKPVSIDRADQGMQLWLPDPANSTVIGTWPAGEYRINVVVADRIVHLVMIVRGDDSTG